MGRWAALLRGVNVGGGAKVPMAQLRALVDALGYVDVCSHLNSGNVVFGADHATSETDIAASIRAAIVREIGRDTPVIVRSAAAMSAVVSANPFPDVSDPKALHVAFCETVPAPDRIAALADAPRGDDDYRVIGREVFLHYPNLLSGAVFMPKGLDRPLGTAVTMRNWRTVTRLAEMARAG